MDVSKAKCFDDVPKLKSAATRSSSDDDTLVRVAVLCGGPSAERGVSLNSARSILDNLHGSGFTVDCYYIDQGLRAFPINARQIYCNTPSDFDFKLRGKRREGIRDPVALASRLRAQGAIAFPALHGAFGEDGVLQNALEEAGVPFVGTDAMHACRAFDKFTCSRTLAAEGFPTLSMTLLEPSSNMDYHATLLRWFATCNLDPEFDYVVVKPARGGSSIGVSIARGVVQASDLASKLFTSGTDSRVVVERYAGSGVEFTITVLGTTNEPVPLIPTEIEILADVEKGLKTSRKVGPAARLEQFNFFDFRRKYLPTMHVVYHTPARFGTGAIDKIRRNAASIFKLLGLRDYARLDGFFMPNGDVAVQWCKEELVLGDSESLTTDGVPVFTDVNVVCGMEQSSFLFQQAAEIGMTHSAVLRHVLCSACHRSNIPIRMQISEKERKSNAETLTFYQQPQLKTENVPCRKVPGYTHAHERVKVYVLFGGGTSERQVSLMSGTNVWLRLREYPEYDVEPLLLEPTPIGCQLDKTYVWHLPYAAVLRHTVEEVLAVAKRTQNPTPGACARAIILLLRTYGWLDDVEDSGTGITTAVRETISEFAATAAAEKAIIFNAVHGGCGEDGTLQALFTEARASYTGSGPASSRLCFDKAATGGELKPLSYFGILSYNRLLVSSRVLEVFLGQTSIVATIWDAFVATVGPAPFGLCIKPNSDGCSTGVARLKGSDDLLAYATAIFNHQSHLHPGDLPMASGIAHIIELPEEIPSNFLVEPFIPTATVCITRCRSGIEELYFEDVAFSTTRWIEVTVGVVGTKGHTAALHPSLTIVGHGDVLSLEEKFQAGTGVNITPLPATIASAEVLSAARTRIAFAANALDIEGFARIDLFYTSILAML